MSLDITSFKDVSVSIFRYLTIPELLNAARVNRRWKEISNSNDVWKPIAKVLLSPPIFEEKEKEGSTNWKSLVKPIFQRSYSHSAILFFKNALKQNLAIESGFSLHSIEVALPRLDHEAVISSNLSLALRSKKLPQVLGINVDFWAFLEERGFKANIEYNRPAKPSTIKISTSNEVNNETKNAFIMAIQSVYNTSVSDELKGWVKQNETEINYNLFGVKKLVKSNMWESSFVQYKKTSANCSDYNLLAKLALKLKVINFTKEEKLVRPRNDRLFFLISFEEDKKTNEAFITGKAEHIDRLFAACRYYTSI